MYILLARHGQTADNASHVFQGHGGRGLDLRGRAQAGRLAERVARASVTAVVSSDLERAVETAAIAAPSHVRTTDRGLREIDVGAWTGKTYREIEQAHPEEWAAWSAGLDLRRGGGETYAELAERVDRSLLEIAATNPGGRVLVVTHGGAIKSWVSRLLDLGAPARRVLGSVANASLTVVEHVSGRAFRLHAWNDTAHLEGMPAEESSD